MQQYNRQSPHSRQNFAALGENIQALRQQLIRPEKTLFDTPRPAGPATIGVQQALQTFAMQTEWQQLDQALQQIESGVHLLDCPILGVAGLLNSGKSSFVASYLSAAGRQRILRGDTSNCGTQRFVFWLPEQWRQDAALWSDLLAQISGLFAGEYALLSTDPAQAHQQYNQQHDAGRHVFDVPLIATDPGLHNLALLDCPDVQRADDAISSAKRAEFLRKAVPICSAFLFVTSQKNIADERAYQVASSLREIMPDVPLHLIMNQVEPDNTYPPHQFLQDKDIKRLVQMFDIQYFYLAYHYKIAGWQAQTPPDLYPLVENPDNQVPAAWQVLPNAADNLPENIQAARFLIHLPEQLKASELGILQVLSHWHRFQNQKVQALASLLHQVQLAQEKAQTLHQQLLDFCHRHTTDAANNPRLPLSPELIKKLHRGMEAAAPVYIRPLLLSGRKMQELITGSVDGVKKMLAKIRLVDKDALDHLKSYALNPQHLGQDMRQTPLRDYVAQAGEDELAQAWQRVVQQADQSAAELAGQLDDKKIIHSASDAWKKIPLAKKVTAIGQGMLALTVSLAVVVLIPLGNPAAAVLAQASLPELIAAAGLGGLSGWGFASTSLARNLEQELFIPYFADFFHTACDVFALPRQLGAEPNTIQLHDSRYTLQAPTRPIQQPAPWCKPPPYWQQNADGFARLEQNIQAIHSLMNSYQSQ